MQEINYQVMDCNGNPVPRYNDQFVREMAMKKEIPVSEMFGMLTDGSVDLWLCLDGDCREILGSPNEVEQVCERYRLADLGDSTKNNDETVVIL